MSDDPVPALAPRWARPTSSKDRPRELQDLPQKRADNLARWQDGRFAPAMSAHPGPVTPRRPPPRERRDGVRAVRRARGQRRARGKVPSVHPSIPPSSRSAFPRLRAVESSVVRPGSLRPLLGGDGERRGDDGRPRDRPDASMSRRYPHASARGGGCDNPDRRHPRQGTGRLETVEHPALLTPVLTAAGTGDRPQRICVAKPSPERWDRVCAVNK